MADPGSSLSADQSSALAAGGGGGGKRKLITEAGNRIMQEALNQDIYDPTLEQRKEMLAKIRALPGCEEYKMYNLTSWFRTRRDTRDRRLGLHKAPAPEQSPYPSIAPKKRKALETVFKTNQNPTQEVIAAWADLTEAKAEDIQKWVRDKQASLIHQPCPPIQTDIAMPAPSSAPLVIHTITGFKSEVSVSPVISPPSLPSAPVPDRHFHEAGGHPVMSPSKSYPPSRATTTSMSPSLSASVPGYYAHLARNLPAMSPSGDAGPPTPRTSTPPPEVLATRRDELLLIIHSAFGANNEAVGKLPGTAEEFKEQVAPFEKTFSDFLRKVENGELSHWGLRKETAR